MRSRSSWGALHFPNRRSRRSMRMRGLGQLVLQPFPTGEGPLIVPLEVQAEIEEEEGFAAPPEEEPPPVELTIGKTPGAVPVRPGNWNLEAKPFATYKIASGDTFFGLAITYLGDGARAMEIYNTGNNHAIIGPDPNVITTQGPIDMPEEARDNMIAFLKKGKPPGQLPGEIPPAEVKRIKEQPKRIVAGIIAAVAIVTVGVVVYNVAT